MIIVIVIVIEYFFGKVIVIVIVIVQFEPRLHISEPSIVISYMESIKKQLPDWILAGRVDRAETYILKFKYEKMKKIDFFDRECIYNPTFSSR